MKRVFFMMLAVTLLLLAGCAKPESDKTPERNNIVNTDHVTIGYGFSSYAMFSTDQGIIDDLLDRFNSLSFEKTTEEMDLGSAFNVILSRNENSVKSFWVDKNGVFWLDGKTQCYKISSGSFDYGNLKSIYEDSKNIKR